MSLIDRLRNGCIQHPQKTAITGFINETATNAMMREAAEMYLRVIKHAEKYMTTDQQLAEFRELIADEATESKGDE